MHDVDRSIRAFEKWGVEETRLRLQQKRIPAHMVDEAIAWLAAKDHLSGRETRTIARNANAIATAALIMATIAAVAAIISAIPVVVGWL